MRIGLLTEAPEHDVEFLGVVDGGINTAVLNGVPSSLRRTGTVSRSPMVQLSRPPHKKSRAHWKVLCMRRDYLSALELIANASVPRCVSAKFISRRGGLLTYREGCELMLERHGPADLMNKIVETLGVVVEDARFEFKENQMQATVVKAQRVARGHDRHEGRRRSV